MFLKGAADRRPLDLQLAQTGGPGVCAFLQDVSFSPISFHQSSKILLPVAGGLSCPDSDFVLSLESDLNVLQQPTGASDQNVFLHHHEKMFPDSRSSSRSGVRGQQQEVAPPAGCNSR